MNGLVSGYGTDSDDEETENEIPAKNEQQQPKIQGKLKRSLNVDKMMSKTSFFATFDVTFPNSLYLSLNLMLSQRNCK